MQTNKPILTITGSDPAGVSGVQADIKVISQLGGYAVSAITSVTVQNTLGIQDFHDLPASVVEGQVEAIMNDVEPQTVKIGMIRTKETLAVIVSLLSRYRPQNVIFMPVMYSAQGERLVSDELVGAIRQQLLPLCTLVVQNTQFSSHGEANMFASAVAYYLNAGYGKADALKHARRLLDTQPTSYSGLKSRSRDLYEQFMREVEHCYKTNSDGNTTHKGAVAQEHNRQSDTRGGRATAQQHDADGAGDSLLIGFYVAGIFLQVFQEAARHVANRIQKQKTIINKHERKQTTT